MRLRADLLVVGSGFAGSLAASVASRLGRRVLLLERGKHPRFALGESSTPLAALSLRRLAERYRLEHVLPLTAYGRWLAERPELRRGLKRGFTFYGHAGSQGGGSLPGRLLVAASPSDELADSHWLREDVDAFLARAAALEPGVELLEETEVMGLELGAGGPRLEARRHGEALELEAGFLVDASGGALLPRFLPELAHPEPSRVWSTLLYSHFAGVADLAERIEESGLKLAPGPYPDGRAAVHHLLEEGWIYLLPFDHGIASAGLLIDHARPGARELLALAEASPEAAWRRVLGRYPWLERQFEPACATFPLRRIARVQHRMRQASGPGWLALPGAFAFTDPLFSTGIAWSLLGVERLGRLLEAEERPGEEGLERYDRLLRQEADFLDRLLAGAYRALADFPRFAAFCQLYFAAASFGETERRLFPERCDWAWEGFLGCQDEAVAGALEGALARLAAEEVATEAFAEWIAEAIAGRNVAGLADPARGNLYPADVETVVRQAHLLGLTEEEVRDRVPMLLR
ncbi:MAG: tryptophan 7-halogenase [Thermoanaerobaculia bacterium]